MENSLLLANRVLNIGFELLDYIGINANICRKSELCNISQLMLQMALVKLKSIINLIENPVSLSMADNDSTYVDPFSIVCIERSIYELLAMHHFLFIENKTQEQKEFALKIWKVAGLSNRKDIKMKGPIQKKYQSKQDKEKEFIDSLLQDIHNSRFYVNTNDKGREKIDQSCKKLTPIFVKEDDGKIEISVVVFSDVYKYLYPQESNYSVTSFKYRMMSFQSHPSYLGVLQFGQQNKATVAFWRAPITGAACFCAKLVNEVSLVIPKVSDALEILDNKYENVIRLAGGNPFYVNKPDKNKDS